MNLTNPSIHTGTSSDACGSGTRSVRPAVSVRSDEHGTRLSVALPGVPREDVKMSLHQRVLNISATRPGLDPAIRYSFSFQLDDKLDEAAVKAGHEDGVLIVTIPLKEESRPRVIPID